MFFQENIFIISIIKKDTFTVEYVDAALRYYIPTLARRNQCFPRKLENLRAVVAVFVTAYNRFSIQKNAIVSDIYVTLSLFLSLSSISFNSLFGHFPLLLLTFGKEQIIL